MNRQQFQLCLMAFVERDYARCLQKASAMNMDEGVSLEFMQLYLMSLQRLGLPEAAEMVGGDFVRAAENTSWPQILLRLTLGKVALPDALALAGNDEERCQALYYAGSLALLDKENGREVARTVFKLCLSSQTDCLEKYLAGVDLEKEIAAADAELPVTAERRVEELLSDAERMHDLARYQDGIALAEEARTLARVQLGADHCSFGKSLNSLASLYQAAGQLAQAEPLYEQLLDLCRAEGWEQLHTAALNNLAALKDHAGERGEAVELFREALELLRRSQRENDPEFATCLANLSQAYRRMGRHAEAEDFGQRAVDARRALHGEHHPAYGSSVLNMAGLYLETGDLTKCEELHRLGLEVIRVALGPKHPDYAAALSSYSRLHAAMGDWSRAASSAREAIEVARSALGPAHPALAPTLASLAMAYCGMGRGSDAATLLREALDIFKASTRDDNPDSAVAIMNIVSLCQGMGVSGDAEDLAERATELLRVKLGDASPIYAIALGALGTFYLQLGKYDLAEPTLERAVGAIRAGFGDMHPHLATCLNNVAVLYASTGRPGEALALMRRAASVDDHTIGQVFSFGSEAQRLTALKAVQANADAFLSLVLQHMGTLPEATGCALDLMLRRKAVGAEAMAAQRDAILTGDYPHLKEPLRELSTIRMQIAQNTLAGPGREGRQAHERQLADSMARKDRLEGELARQIPEMNLERRLHATDRHVLASLLPLGTALVEFAKFDVFDFTATATPTSDSRWSSPRRWRPSHYLAFVLLAGAPEAVRMIDLGEACDIDALIARFRGSVTGEGRGLGAAPSVTTDEEANRIGAQLCARVFDPLRETLGDRCRIFLSPDGDLTRLPFEVLPAGPGRRLIDGYEFRYLAAGRDVVRFGKRATRPLSAPLVAADPDFDLRAAAAGSNSPRSEQRADSAGRHSRDVDRSMRFGRLDGTRREGEAIARMLGVEPWVDTRALEGRLKAIRSPRILHLATHGFFLQDQERDLEATHPDAGLNLGGEHFAASRMENPLLRSGVALAGANTWLAGGQPAPDAEDGILTAEDVSGLDLLDTEMVVLSACETGLGEVRTGEGVFGLRRAFVLAGARTLVMSLWKVPDEQTKELMEDFYRRLLEGEDRADALRHAQLTIRQRHAHPFYWGAFICQGEPGPLTGGVNSLAADVIT